MTMDIAGLGARALGELGQVIEAMDQDGFMLFVDALAGANRLVLHGVGREGLMMRALAMRLYHLGLDAHVLGDMTTPPVGAGDLLVVSAGPGYFSSVEALARTARAAGADLACVTAQPGGPVPKMADHLLVLPAQTMADDQPDGEAELSVLPMGSLYEGAQYIAFELVVLALGAKLEVSPEALRGRHTNLE
ncbi:MAG: 6-phospho-3-hexuloisomerase [Hyphomicrobiales bacterium]|nr:MAG: 6-phospho-3-hexuloisomerase [Hyphomicrobiales bacterium]